MIFRIFTQMLPGRLWEHWIFSVNSPPPPPPTSSNENFNSLPHRSELVCDWLKFTRAWVKPKTLGSYFFAYPLWCLCVGGRGGGSVNGKDSEHFYSFYEANYHQWLHQTWVAKMRNLSSTTFLTFPWRSWKWHSTSAFLVEVLFTES